MANTTKMMVTAVFRDPIKGQKRLRRVAASGLRLQGEGINVLMSDTTRSTYFPHDRNDEPIQASNYAADGMGVGGAIGSAVGATLAAVMAIGTSILVPGLGIVVAGPIAAALAGGAGAVTGGLIGALVGMGIPEPNARAYQTALREGGVIIGVVPKDDDDVARLKQYFEAMHGERICYC
jgi:hypothetical protein